MCWIYSRADVFDLNRFLISSMIIDKQVSTDDCIVTNHTVHVDMAAMKTTSIIGCVGPP